jgi:RNA polymerase sigma-70 factor (ECF subfamily)
MRTDQQLLEKAQAGDRRALDEILSRHEQQIFRFGLRMCGNEDDARDVLQETLLTAFQKVHTFRGDAQLSTWLYQIARNFCARSRRGAPAAVGEQEAAAVASPDAPPDAEVHAKQIGALLQSAILTLPESQREVLVLRDVEGLSAEEAAQVIGIEIGALKSRLHRARLDLRGKLASMLGPNAATAPCPDLAGELAAFAAEEIDQATCARIEEHLSRCPRCAGACATLRRTVSFCKQIPGGEVPAPVRAAVRAALLRSA